MKNKVLLPTAEKRTKIVATIGPASEKEETLRAMIKEGMNVARFNFSHGDFAWHKKIMRRLRNVSKKMGVPVGIMADLQGPRIRIANEREVLLQGGELVLVTDKAIGGKESASQKQKVVYIDVPKIAQYIKVGNEILVEDGLIKMTVLGKKGKMLRCAVVDGGIVKPRKGVNIPGISGKFGALTARDREVLKFALKEDVDFVAMSFVRTAKEINNLKEIIRREYKGRNVPQVVAKIERKEAIANFEEIVKATDAVMVARGDLGIEMPQSDLPILQKEIITRCLKSAKPVIVATQMLDSMIRNPRPTRAEITDVSNAVIDHTDAVMLSGESANGKYPVEAVKMMREIAEKTEASPFDNLGHGFLGDQASSVSASVAQAAHELLKNSNAKAVVVASISGFTARMIVRHRPENTILVVTNNTKTQNQLTIVWGVKSFVLPDCKTLDDLIDKSVAILKNKKLLKKGDRVLVVTGRPHMKREHMSLIKIEEVK